MRRKSRLSQSFNTVLGIPSNPPGFSNQLLNAPLMQRYNMSNLTSSVNPLAFMGGENTGDGLSVEYPRVRQNQASSDWHPYTPLEIAAPTFGALQSPSEPDWRDQIYYWLGTLSYDASTAKLQWKGTWLGSFTGRPLAEEFSASRNVFHFTSQDPLTDANIDKQRTKPLSGYYEGFYLVDTEGEGNDMERCEEKDVLLDFESDQQEGSEDVSDETYTVYGRGDSEFGVFILHGRYYVPSGVLDLTRQYLPETDPRGVMSLQQLKFYFKRMTGQTK